MPVPTVVPDFEVVEDRVAASCSARSRAECFHAGSKAQHALNPPSGGSRCGTCTTGLPLRRTFDDVLGRVHQHAALLDIRVAELTEPPD